MAIKFQPIFLSGFFKNLLLNLLVVYKAYNVPRGVCVSTPGTESSIDAFHSNPRFWRPLQKAVKNVHDRWGNLVGLDYFWETSNSQIVPSAPIVKFLNVALNIPKL